MWLKEAVTAFNVVWYLQQGRGPVRGRAAGLYGAQVNELKARNSTPSVVFVPTQ